MLEKEQDTSRTDSAQAPRRSDPILPVFIFVAALWATTLAFVLALCGAAARGDAAARALPPERADASVAFLGTARS